MLSRLPALARFLFALVAIDLVVFAAFRGAFWAAFHEALANASRADLLKALYLGLKFDLRLALLLCLPLALLGWIAPFDPARRRAARIGWLGYLAFAHCVVLLAYFVDFGHYAWVRVRLNASLVDHLTPGGVGNLSDPARRVGAGAAHERIRLGRVPRCAADLGPGRESPGQVDEARDGRGFRRAHHSGGLGQVVLVPAALERSLFFRERSGRRA